MISWEMSVTPTRTGETLLQILFLGYMEFWGHRHGRHASVTMTSQFGLNLCLFIQTKEVEFSSNFRKLAPGNTAQGLAAVSLLTAACFSLAIPTNLFVDYSWDISDLSVCATNSSRH